MSATDTRAVSLFTGAWVLFRRVLTNYRNSPGLFAITLAAPLGMMLLFGFVFGGALAGGGDASEYRSYLVPGVLVLVAAMGLTSTAMTANADLHSGFTDRIRALPLSAAAAPAGFALAETVVGTLAIALMAGAGYLMGWRIDATPSEIVAALVLLLAFRCALSWLGIALGAAVRDEQMLQQTAPLIFGTLMFSNVFVPTSSMPTVIAAIAEWNPVSSLVAALRELLGAGLPDPAGSAWPMQHPVAAATAWMIALFAVAVPIAIRRYSTDS
ncbi:ABC transporter permease [Nocardia alba]|uniref:Transport permease protein n=1 Tax=Nocardia alba TaxID=225051 RepID=A0A4R1FJ92_9NOCA|nr:ABC transporter permease [Nocardia alba]TCJ93299.1 ABC-2 type transport system permease protein [Nocardia alba]